MGLLEDRRALHQIPELDKDLPQTMAYLHRALEPLPCALSSPIAGSLCAFFDFGQPTAIAVRSDADALPIQETTGLPYASRHPGRMHACGHDGHMAMVLELAHRLTGRLQAHQSLPHNILLVFQPAEETTGGALDLVKSGVFEDHKVAAIFGLHLWPDLPAGIIASREGALMSRTCEITLEITGRSSHVAKAEEGLDAMAAAVVFHQRTAQLEASLPPQVYRLCKFGKLTAGTVRNAIAGQARMEGTLRAFQDQVFYQLLDRLHAIAREVAEQTGCQLSLTTSEGYPAVNNPAPLYRKVRAACPGLWQEMENPVMISEDFSWYQAHLPGIFFFLGAGPAPALHADNFQFPEGILETGADFWETLVTHYQP